jgi:phosphatidylglycerophosphate synthase
MTTSPDGARPPLAAAVLAFPVPGADPLDELAGLPLALRTALTLQKEGASRVHLAVPEGRADIAPRITGDKRLKVPVEVVPAASAARGLSLILRRSSGPVLVGRPEAVVDPAIYRALRSAAPLAGAAAAAPAVVAMRDGQPAGPLLASPELADLLDASETSGSASVDALIARLLEDGRATRIDVGAVWAARADTPEGRRLAFRELFEACRKPVDGIVARHINRHISIFISKRVVGLPVTPNMLSVFTFLLGVAGAVFVGMGGYWYTLLGAFLFQWNSILDGVDGELARVRFQHSKLGQWLDTISDDASNLIFYAGLAIGARSLPFGEYLAICGWVGIIASALATAQYYTEMIRIGSGDLYAIDWDFDKKPPEGFAGKVLIFWRYVVKKDFAILFFLALAVFGVLPYALPIIGGAAIGTLIAATLRSLKKRKLAAA